MRVMYCTYNLIQTYDMFRVIFVIELLENNAGLRISTTRVVVNKYLYLQSYINLKV